MSVVQAQVVRAAHPPSEAPRKPMAHRSVWRARLLCAVWTTVLVGGMFAVAVPASGTARAPSRYFEVRIRASGSLGSKPVCTANVPCEGDYLTGHGLGWDWIAYALVVAVQQGHHTQLHLIGPKPRIAANFDDGTSHSHSDDCHANFSTGGRYALFGAFMATRLGFADKDGILSVDAGPPMDSHFSQCGQGTVSSHGLSGGTSAWDGLKGPWNYSHVRGPTRGQVRHRSRFDLIAYNQSLGGEHTTGGWLHTSCCGSSLSLSFIRFPGGSRSVFERERNFVRCHPVTSTGFKYYPLPDTSPPPSLPPTGPGCFAG